MLNRERGSVDAAESPKRNILVLTSTIKPPAGVPKLVRTDPAQRLADYCNAFDFYCRLPETHLSRIIFAENSEADLSPLVQIARKYDALSRVEFLSFNGLDYPASYGRGYGEFKLLDYVMANSGTLRDEDVPQLRIWKSTGRYRVTNLKRLIETAPDSFDLYCDLRRHPIPWVDLRVFAFTMHGYRTLLQGRYKNFREDQMIDSPECYLHPIIEKLAAKHSITTRFRREPYIDGVRGMDSKNYSKGANLVKYWIRAGTRFF
jgi:hypothetical protein